MACNIIYDVCNVYYTGLRKKPIFNVFVIFNIFLSTEFETHGVCLSFSCLMQVNIRIY